jgi:hypothetical protein
VRKIALGKKLRIGVIGSSVCLCASRIPVSCCPSLRVGVLSAARRGQVTAGHDGYWNTSFPIVFHLTMKPLFATLGIDVSPPRSALHCFAKRSKGRTAGHGQPGYGQQPHRAGHDLRRGGRGCVDLPCQRAFFAHAVGVLAEAVAGAGGPRARAAVQATPTLWSGSWT